MSTAESTVTTKYQATIPRPARHALGLKSGDRVTWHILGARVVIDVHRKMKGAAHFLASQGRMPADVIKLVRQVRREIA